MTVPVTPIDPFISIQRLSVSGTSRDSSGLPAALANARNGQLIEGFVVNRDSSQNPILRTPLGDILIKSDLFLKTGSVIQIRVDAQLESRARIMLIDGVNLETYAKNNAQRAPGDTILPSSIAPQAKGQIAQQNAGVPARLSLPGIVLSTPTTANSAANPSATPANIASSIAPSGNAPSANISTNAPYVQITILTSNLPTQSTTQTIAPELLQALNNPASSPSAASAAQQPSTPASNAAQPISPLQTQGNAPQTPASTPIITPANSTATPPTANANATPVANIPAAQPTIGSAANNAEITTQLLASNGPPPTTARVNAALPPAYQPANLQQAPTAAAPTATPNANATTPANAAPTTTATTTAPATATTLPPATGQLVRVIGQQADGTSIISGNDGSSFKLFTAKALPIGSELRISVTPSISPHEANANIPPKLAEFSNLATHWPALEDVASLIAATQGTSLALNVNSLAPTIGPQLTTQLLFFLSAIRGGDVSRFWPREIVKYLEEKRPDLLQRLSHDSAQMQQLAQPQSYPNWSAFMLPLLYNQHAQQLRLYLREDEDNASASADSRSQRFIMELELSHLGQMQLDGLVLEKHKDKARQFDLVIRTIKPLPDAMEADIFRLFQTAIEATKLAGSLRFQEGRHHFIYPASQLSDNPDKPADDFTIIA
jgi:hypothetical protein